MKEIKIVEILPKKLGNKLAKGQFGLRFTNMFTLLPCFLFELSKSISAIVIAVIVVLGESQL